MGNNITKFKDALSGGLMVESEFKTVLTSINSSNSAGARKAFIKDFMAGKMELFNIEYTIGGKLIKASFSAFDLNIFGSTRMLEWDVIFGLFSGDRSARSTIISNLEEATRYAFESSAISSLWSELLNRVGMKHLTDIKKDNFFVKSLSYKNIFVYKAD